MAQKPRSRSLGLYVHVPFCVHKCGYCDFNSWAETTRGPQDRWLEALTRQVEYWATRLGRGPAYAIDTVFFGGGTPSLLEEEVLVKAGRRIRDAFPLAADLEWTFECNPETLNESKISALRESGANRLSVGIQSFRDQHLERLERRARRHDNLRALETLGKHWRGRWSMDLMFGLPGQSMREMEEDLETALGFGPRHLSFYQLTLTTERSKNWRQGGDDELLEMFDRVEARAARAGLLKYETSNFAAPGEESRHNLRYWELRDFLGLGPGASGLLSGSLLGEGDRFGAHQRNPDKFELWCQGAGLESSEKAWFSARSPSDHLMESLMMGLRLKRGIEAGRTGLAPEQRVRLLELPQIAELLEEKSGVWQATPKGERQLDTLLKNLVGELEKSEFARLDSSQIDPSF